jgi:guanylate kinase
MNTNAPRATDRILFVISGPSGSGKGSVLSCVQERAEHLSRVVTYTTRQPRPGESENNPYHFVSDETFKSKLESGEIYESETVYGSYQYGSPREAVDGQGEGDLIMELDPAGFRHIRTTRNGPTVGLFLLVPDWNTLSQRIHARNPEADMDRRLAAAKNQIRESLDYEYLLMNDDLERCCQDVLHICRAERIRRDGRVGHARFLATAESSPEGS